MLKIGILSALIGPYRVPGEDGIRGAKLALEEHGYSAGGQSIEIQIEATNAMPASASGACERLISEGIRLFVGPLSGNEAIAVRDVANKNPACTFVNGSAGSQPMFDPAENFFMFNPTGAQVMTGLGKYCYETLNFKRVATIGEAYSFPFAQIGGFAHDFVNAGGEISKFLWCALGAEDYTEQIEQIPDDIDAIFSSLGGTDGLYFIEQYRKVREDLPFIAGSIFADQSFLNSIEQHAEFLNGTVSASANSDDIDTEAGRAFVDAYRAAYPDGFYAPSFFAFCYYINMKAILLALDETNGDWSQMQDALRTLNFESPTGSIYLDHHRVAVIDTFINEIRTTAKGEMYTHMLQRIPQTTSTFGMTDEAYMKIGNFGVNRMPGLKTRTFEDIVREVKERHKNS